jgi:predicted SAM-dependent methyltransferase
MIYAVQNTAGAARIFYDSRNREINLAPGAMKYADLDQGTVDRLLARNDLVVKEATFERHAHPQPLPPKVTPEQARPCISVTGHFGIGDNLHQRAVMRVLMRDYDVWLHTCHFQIYHDLVAKGLKLVMRPTSLHAQAKTIERERGLFEQAKFTAAPPSARVARIGYPKTLVDQHGSILEAMFGCVGLQMPERPDFSLPIKPEWRQSTRDRLSRIDMGGKRLMVHRPIVVRREWDGRSRNPDPAAYDAIFRSIRDSFYVVSIADLRRGEEWIEGLEQEADLKLHNGELAFEEMAALFSEADLVYCNAGFAPVLAQAVGTPLIVVYGGRESYRTTQRVGAHLAPTLPIDVLNPCDCHSNKHRCDKAIDVPKALAAVTAFAARRSTLLFGTFYVDSPDRDNLTDLWMRLHFSLNERECDFLAVDSQSPIRKFEDWTPYDGRRHHRMVFNFPDNIGHLSRKGVTEGRDGWGRAFCKGLEIACELGYEHVAHVEGDSLFRLRVGEIVKWMQQEKADCATTDVKGMKHKEHEKLWVETGLMFFSTDYLRRSDFVRRYDWPNRKVAPTPERYIRQQILARDGCRLRVMSWKAQRADKNQITKDNILDLDLDWVTHQHDSAQQGVYRKFVEAALAVERMKPNELVQERASILIKLNLGCGTNKLAGWENRDADVDITKKLPWPDGSVSHVNIEHCVEHVPYKAAIGFFQEAHRVLAPGGVLRVTVPSLEQIAACDDADYHRFTTKWQKLGPNKRGAMSAIIYAHGHECAWNAQLLRDTLYFAGFDDVLACESGLSEDPALRGVEGHGRVIGDHFNQIESCTFEARKAGDLSSLPSLPSAPQVSTAVVAVVLGGAMCWRQDWEAARKLIGDLPFRVFAINDQIKTFPDECVAVTLHPDKLVGPIAWLNGRRKAGLPEPEQVWAHRKAPEITHDTGLDWGGSSGLFAVQVARREGHQKVIGVGVPMTVDGAHYIRGQKWQSAIAFRPSWIRYKNEIAPHFRSMSGWTAEIFGKPDEAFLRSA